jgi:hypothetical protein
VAGVSPSRDVSWFLAPNFREQIEMPVSGVSKVRIILRALVIAKGTYTLTARGAERNLKRLGWQIVKVEPRLTMGKIGRGERI